MNTPIINLFFNLRRRFDPSISSIHRRVQAGEIGKIRCIRTIVRDKDMHPIEYLRGSGETNSWNDIAAIMFFCRVCQFCFGIFKNSGSWIYQVIMPQTLTCFLVYVVLGKTSISIRSALVMSVTISSKLNPLYCFGNPFRYVLVYVALGKTSN